MTQNPSYRYGSTASAGVAGSMRVSSERRSRPPLAPGAAGPLAARPHAAAFVRVGLTVLAGACHPDGGDSSADPCTACSGAATAAGGSSGGSGSDGTGDFGVGGGTDPDPTIFVRIDGDDACDGKADAPGPPAGGSCAFATIEAALAAAACGDVIAVRAGRYGEAAITADLPCPPDTPVVLRGDGRDRTWWMAALVSVPAGGCQPDPGLQAHRCPLPGGAIAPGPSPDPRTCVVQGNPGVVHFADENGVQGDMTGPLCLTWSTGGALGAAASPGHVAVQGDDLWVRPWNDESPQSADLWANRGCGPSGGTPALDLRGGSFVVEDLSLVSGCGTAVRLSGGDQVLRDVSVYTGTVVLATRSVGARLERVRIANAYRRPVDETSTSGSNAWNTNSQALSVWGASFVIEDVETYAAREGAGFANGAHDGVVDGATFHGHHNHGFKIQDEQTRNLVFRDLLVYNTQEAAFIECPRDIQFVHATLPNGPVVVQGNPGGCTPARLSFLGSVLCGITWFAYGGDTWAEPGGHVLDWNVYVSGDPACRGRIRHLPTDGTFDLTQWRAWSDDTCSDCVRDPNSVEDTVDAAFVNFVFKDDSVGANPDFHPTSSAAGIDHGAADAADARDRDGKVRTPPPDAGCFEF